MTAAAYIVGLGFAAVEAVFHPDIPVAVPAIVGNVLAEVARIGAATGLFAGVFYVHVRHSYPELRVPWLPWSAIASIVFALLLPIAVEVWQMFVL